jgi:urease accessory protein UreE
MIRIDRVHDGPLPPQARVHEVALAFDERVKSRLAVLCEDGVGAAIVLARGSVLRDGAVLAGPDGEFVRVRAAPQPRCAGRAPWARPAPDCSGLKGWRVVPAPPRRRRPT